MLSSMSVYELYICKLIKKMILMSQRKVVNINYFKIEEMSKFYNLQGIGVGYIREGVKRY